jgi:N-acetylglutamate synthase-like GNAT family acetyltransferase
MEVVTYEPKYRQSFVTLNTGWILEHFGFLEAEDKSMFSDLESYLAKGAMVFFAVEDDVVLATCMALPMEEDGLWEICKLAADPAHPHKGAGTSVFRAAMDYAIENGAKRLFLISNSKLKPALHIYEKHGFREILLEDYGFSRGDIAFGYDV